MDVNKGKCLKLIINDGSQFTVTSIIIISHYWGLNKFLNLMIIRKEI